MEPDPLNERNREGLLPLVSQSLAEQRESEEFESNHNSTDPGASSSPKTADLTQNTKAPQSAKQLHTKGKRRRR